MKTFTADTLPKLTLVNLEASPCTFRAAGLPGLWSCHYFDGVFYLTPAA